MTSDRVPEVFSLSVKRLSGEREVAEGQSDPGNTEWSKRFQESEKRSLRWSTIHEAKGWEYDAVCIVLPPDRGDARNTSKLLDVWENRVDEEAKRVIYVGARSLVPQFFYKAAFFDLVENGRLQESERFGSLTSCLGIGFCCFLDDEHQPATVGEVQDPFTVFG